MPGRQPDPLHSPLQQGWEATWSGPTLQVKDSASVPPNVHETFRPNSYIHGQLSAHLLCHFFCNSMLISQASRKKNRMDQNQTLLSTLLKIVNTPILSFHFNTPVRQGHIEFLPDQGLISAIKEDKGIECSSFFLILVSLTMHHGKYLR